MSSERDWSVNLQTGDLIYPKRGLTVERDGVVLRLMKNSPLFLLSIIRSPDLEKPRVAIRVLVQDHDVRMTWALERFLSVFGLASRITDNALET